MWKFRAAVVIVGVLFAGCSSSDGQAVNATGDGSVLANSTTVVSIDPAQTVQEPAPSGPVICGDTVLTSLEAFDAQQGTYAAYIPGYVSGQPEFDVIQWLSGAQAEEAFLEMNPDSVEGPPGGVLLRNENPRRRIAPVAADASVAVLASRDADELASSSPLGFERYVESRNGAPVFAWLTFEAGDIVSVCEQRLP